MDFKTFFSKCVAVTAVQSSVDQLDNEAAVYAFFDLLAFRSAHFADDIDRFKTHNARDLRMEKSDAKERFLPDHVRIYLRGDPKRFKGEGLKISKDMDVSNLDEVVDQISFLSLLNEPLYIGQTRNLRTRFREHHDKDFLYFMKHKKQRDPNEFLFFAFYSDRDHVRLIESVLLQIVKPPFSDQRT